MRPFMPMTRTTKRAAPILLLFLFLPTAGCVQTSDLVPEVSLDAASAIVLGDIDHGSLERGRRVYLTRCTRCHSPEPVVAYSVTRWQKIISDMSLRSRLIPLEETDLRAYVTSVRRLFDMDNHQRTAKNNTQPIISG